MSSGPNLAGDEHLQTSASARRDWADQVMYTGSSSPASPRWPGATRQHTTTTTLSSFTTSTS